jgi:predicted transglutaminase-like cysteine proteinase
MRLIIAFILILLAVSGCSSVPEAPGISSGELLAVEARYGKEARERVQSWRQLIEANKPQPDSAKLEMTNQFFNRLIFEDDSLHWGVNDYWATPVETLATNGGDCEDFSVGKYFTLIELGVADQCLRLT